MQLINAIFFLFYYKITFFRLEYSTKERIELYQFRQLKKVIDNAWNNVPFYKKHWTENNFHPNMFQTLADFDKIPFIDKDIIRNNCETMVSKAANRKTLHLSTTGGTTGMPMKFYSNRLFSRVKELAFMLNEYKKINYKFYDRIVILRGDYIDEKLINKGVYWKIDRKQNALIFSSFHLNASTIEVYVDKIREFKPKYIKAYPSSSVVLCKLMNKMNVKHFEGLRKVICSSENVYDWQRDIVKKILKVDVYSRYGHSEKAVFAGECEHSRYMHFNPFYGYTEFINKENKRCSREGEKGEVVVTGFKQDDFPFIRYKTNDIIEHTNKKCECKRNYLLAKKIIGREQDFLIDINGNDRIFTCSDDVFWGYEDKVAAYQYIQNKRGVIDLLVEADKLIFSENDIKKIKLECIKYFPDFEINMKIVDSIPRTKSGKFRYLIQNISQ